MATKYTTKQEVFDHVYKRMAAQGFQQSRDENNTGCRYRGAHNRVCAIGTMIDDDQYFPKLEEYSVQRLVADKIINVSHELARSKIFQYLQCDHDMGYTPNIMRRNFESTANLLNLTVPTIEA